MRKFIIHTNSYAGNFERDMCAYITGQIGECGRGDKYIDPNIKEIYDPYIIQVDDDEGCKRPVTIYTSPYYKNNGLGYHFDSTDVVDCVNAKQAHIDCMRSEKLAKLQEKLDFYKDTMYDTGRIVADINQVRSEIYEYSKIPAMEIPSYHAYNSVCIYVSDDIPTILLDKMKIRAKSFIVYNDLEIEIIGFEIVDEEPVSVPEPSDTDTLKVKVVAYNNHLLIETLDADIYDKDFIPVGSGRIGCILNNINRLGVSKEAYEILCQLEPSNDDIEDISWDETGFAWLGGIYSIKGSDISGTYMENYIEIPNIVSDEQTEAVDSSIMKKNIPIDYSDVVFHPWIEIRKSHYSSDYRVSIYYNKAHLYNNETIINAPENCIEYGESTSVYISDAYKHQICEKIYSIFGEEFKSNSDDSLVELYKKLGREYKPEPYKISIEVKDEYVMSYINRFFEIGFDNNLMYPDKRYWRLTYNSTLDNYLTKLNEY